VVTSPAAIDQPRWRHRDDRQGWCSDSDDRCVTTSELCAAVGIRIPVVITIIRESGYRNVCARWMPKMLTVEHKPGRKKKNLWRTFPAQWGRWNCFFFVKNNHWRRDSQWSGTISRRHSRKKFKVHTSAVQVMVRDFWNSERILLSTGILGGRGHSQITAMCVDI